MESKRFKMYSPITSGGSQRKELRTDTAKISIAIGTHINIVHNPVE